MVLLLLPRLLHFPLLDTWELHLRLHVLAYRWTTTILEILISWLGRPQQEATWEECDLFHDHFPHTDRNPSQYATMGLVDEEVIHGE